MTDTFKIEELQKRFEGHATFSIDKLHQFYKEEEPDLPRSTLRWRVYQLINQRILRRVERGVYTLKGDKSNGKPKLQPTILQEIDEGLQNKFPYTTFCLWSTQWLLDLTHHMPVNDFIIIDTERETEESVFYYLQNTLRDYSVYLKPGKSEIEKYLGSEENSIVVRSLISQSPLMIIEEVQVPKLEKIMVDLIADNLLFRAYQGKELRTIFENILDLYAVNHSTLRRYAKRRNKWNKVKSHLAEFSIKTIDNPFTGYI